MIVEELKTHSNVLQRLIRFDSEQGAGVDLYLPGHITGRLEKDSHNWNRE